MTIRDLFLAFLLLTLAQPLAAQHRDTVYVERETVTYDTVTVYDTVHVHDTLNIADYLRSEEFERLFYSSEYVDNLSLTDSMKEKLLRQTVTFWERSVFKDEQQTFSSMDSIKKYGLAGLIILGLNAMSSAQTDSTVAGTAHNPKQKKIHLLDNPMNGFHLGYTIQYDLIEPVLTKEMSGLKQHGHSSIISGFHAGLEFSYHFADYFGVSAGLNYGNVGAVFQFDDEHDPWGLYHSINQYGFSFPLKFEFCYPVSKNLLFTASAGARIRVPFSAYIQGFNKETGALGNSCSYNLRADLVYDRNIIQTDILLDAGIYYRLPNEDYLRFTVGMNMAMSDYMHGIVNIKGSTVIFDDEPTGSEPDYYTVSHRNNHLYFQVAYIQSFNKKRKIMQAQPHWSTEVGMHRRHEIRLEVGDPLGIMLLQKKNKRVPDMDYEQDMKMAEDGNWSAVGHAWRATPVFSLNYHYRLTKWLWAGAMGNYAYYKDQTDYAYRVYNKRWMHCITLMPELRFSYFNRPHVTLYSALAAGATLFLGNVFYADPYESFYWENIQKVYPTFQFTAFGIRAGGERLFGTFEAGFGIKGIVSGGIGYAF